MSRPRPNLDIEWSEITLTKRKVAVSGRLSAQVMHDLHVEEYRDELINGMIYQLSTYVYGHKANDRTVTKRFEREVPAPRGLVATFALFTLILFGVGMALASLPLLAGSSLVAAAGVIVVSMNPPRTVGGTLTVHIDDVDTFPDNTMIFPPELGSAVRIPMTRDSYYRWDDYR